jgi:hypothetical protein
MENSSQLNTQTTAQLHVQVMLGACLFLQTLPLTSGILNIHWSRNSISLGSFDTNYFGAQNASLKSVEKSAELVLFMNAATNELLPFSRRDESSAIVQSVLENASRHDMDPLLIMAVIKHESRFKLDLCKSNPAPLFG